MFRTLPRVDEALVPVSHLTLESGTPVIDRSGQHVGTISRVLVAWSDSFDGVVVTTAVGDRFVDAPEVRRITGDAVELTVALSDVLHPGPPGPPAPPGLRNIRLERGVDGTEDATSTTRCNHADTDRTDGPTHD